jgi:flagellar motor switch protein FliN/FliY
MADSAVAEEKKEKKQDSQAADNQETAGAQAQSAEFSEVSETSPDGKGTSIDLLLDMEVPVTVAIGRTEIPVQRLLQLSPGSVLKLNKPIDMPADLYLKDTRFATGSIVVLEDQFAVKIKEILSGRASEKAEKH